MIDIYIKQVIIHQFSPDDTEIQFAEELLTITPKIEEYLRKKIERVYSDEAKTGHLSQNNIFLDKITSDLKETSLHIAKLWQEEFSLSENQKTNDLIFVQFEKNGVEHFGFLRIALRESLAHVGTSSNQPLQWTQNTLPGAGSTPDEALMINLSNHKYHLIEKRIKHNGALLNYFSENLLQEKPTLSAKKSIQTVEKTAKKIAEQFHQDDFQFQTKVKSAIFQHIEENSELSPEKLADQLFNDNLTARLTFVNEVQDTLPEPLVFDEINTERQLKKLENQKLSLSNGIELIVPHRVYEDAESVEFIQNNNGTYSILIKNIADIKSS